MWCRLPPVILPSSACVTGDGAVFTWGWGNWGYQLGHGGTQDEHRPRRVAGIKDVALVACSGGWMLCVTRGGRLFTWGFGDSYRTGHGDEADRDTPTEVAGVGDVEHASVGLFHGGCAARRRRGCMGFRVQW